LATAIGGEWGHAECRVELTELRTGEIVDRVRVLLASQTDAGAYAVTIVGDSMWPRFRPGRRLAIAPMVPVAIGDDVLVKLNARPHQTGVVNVLIKELVRKTARGIELRQFNPDVTFHVAASEIATIEKVVGELF
jgi:phage repressor protein C with HTH and peptisase S24 domain